MKRISILFSFVASLFLASCDNKSNQHENHGTAETEIPDGNVSMDDRPGMGNDVTNKNDSIADTTSVNTTAGQVTPAGTTTR